MAFIAQLQAYELCRFAHWADHEARSDLACGYIADEDDYTSNFTGALRRIINSNTQTGLSATSFVLKPQIERSMGCDATIMVSANGYIKVAPFEAKLPRLKSSYYQWDYPQTASGLSHFSDQLQRQATLWPQFAIFEMFYCEFPFRKQPKYLNDEGSSCVWHDAAIGFDFARTNKSSIWSRNDLSGLLKRGCSTIGDILASVCKCEHGEPIKMWDNIEAVAQEFGISGQVLHITAGEAEPEQ